jgi:poly(3-hydroxybutyrate) depolymerase
VLACYPELFAGGAIIAGLPFASANTLPEALERMRGQGFPARRELHQRARGASEHSVAPPTVSVWHGTHDTIVVPANASKIVDQWLDLHGLGDAPGHTSAVGSHSRTTWNDAQGRALVERYDVRGMGHGVPIDVGDQEACGTVGPHMLHAGICSTKHIAKSWGLTADGVRSREVTIERSVVSPQAARPVIDHPSAARPAGVGAVIEDALRAAGLMR